MSDDQKRVAAIVGAGSGLHMAAATALALSGMPPRAHGKSDLGAFMDMMDLAAQPPEHHLAMIKALLEPIAPRRPKPPKSTIGRMVYGYGVQLLPVSSTKQMTKRKLRRQRGRDRAANA